MPDNDFLTNIMRQDQVQFEPETTVEDDEKEKETPSDPSAEKEPKEGESESQSEDKDGKDEPQPKESEKSEDEEPAVFEAFHKHPRWRAMQDELRTLRDFQERTLPILEKISTSMETREETAANMPDWFKEAFGDNQEIWQKYLAAGAKEKSSLKEEILNEINSTIQQASAEEQKWDKWVEDSIAELQNEGLEFNRNELLKVAVDYQPSDENGNISLRKAYDILKLAKGTTATPKPDATKKKEIASKTMGNVPVKEKEKDVRTWGEMQGRSFADIPRNAPEE